MVKKGRYAAVFIGLFASLIVVTILNIKIGTVDISTSELIRILLRADGMENMKAAAVIWSIRLPRICMVMVLGGALALAGFLLQTFFANPIAGPYILGISSGAKLCVSLAMIFFFSRFGATNSIELIIAAFLGSIAAMMFVLIVSRKVPNMGMLLVAGIMFGYICTAITDFIITFADDSDIVNLRNWSLGSFSGTNWESVGVATVVVIIASILVFTMSKPIGAFQLGEGYARSMGVDIRKFKIALVVLSSLLAATVTAFAGPISFVGIAVPHIVKLFLNTSKPIIVIPAAFLGGSVFCMICDLIARTAFAPTELSISTVTAIFGAPIVIWMIIKRQKRI